MSTPLEIDLICSGLRFILGRQNQTKSPEPNNSATFQNRLAKNFLFNANKLERAVQQNATTQSGNTSTKVKLPFDLSLDSTSLFHSFAIHLISPLECQAAGAFIPIGTIGQKSRQIS